MMSKDDPLTADVAAIKAGLAEAEEGRGQDAREAIMALAARHGLKLDIPD